MIRLDRRKHTVPYHAGDTVLETARRGGLRPPFSCEAGNCATCMAHLDTGSVAMRVNNALSADELDEGWVLTCQSIPTSAEVVVNYDAWQRRRVEAQSSGHSELRNASVRSRDSMRASRSASERQHPNGQVGGAGVAEAAQPVDDRGLVARREEVADVGGVAVLEQADVVRRVLGVPERLVRPRPRRVDLVVAAQRHRDAGDDARRGPARLPPRPAMMRGTTWSPMARSSAIHRIVPDASSPAMRSITGASAATRIGVGRDVGDVERVVHAVVVVLDVDRARAGEGRVQAPRGSSARGAPGCSYGRPSMSSTIQWCDGPRPSVNRPSHTAWFASACCAIATGCRVWIGITAVPSSIRAVVAAHEGDRGEGVEVVRDLRDPDRREAGLLGRLGVGHEPRDLLAVAALFGADHQADPHRATPSDERAVGADPNGGRTLSGNAILVFESQLAHDSGYGPYSTRRSSGPEEDAR